MYLVEMFKRKIARDKWRHFYVGIGMGILLQGFAFWMLEFSTAWLSLMVFLVIVAISYGFELFSKITGHGRYYFLDAVASIIGGVLGMLITLIFSLLL